MIRYLGLRLISGFATLLAVVLAAFLLIQLVPGDPARIHLGPLAPRSAVAALRRTEGLDASLTTQFWRFLKGALGGHFGYSFTQHASVSSLVASRIGPTAWLVALGLAFALAIAIPSGVVCGMRAGSGTDRTLRNLGQLFYLMPVFWVGLILSYVFGVELHLLPTSGYGSGISSHIRSLILPSAALALIVAPVFVRILRSSVITSLDSPFVEALASRGVPRHRVLVHHVLRNSAIPLVTTIGLTLGFLVSGSVVIESVFNLPGLGALLVQAVTQRDFQTVQGLTILFGAAVVAVNLITDLLYSAIDPRVRLR